MYSGDEQLSGSLMSSPGIPYNSVSPSTSPSFSQPSSVSDHHHFSQPNSVSDHHLTAELVSMRQCTMYHIALQSPAAAHGSPTMMGMATANEEQETTGIGLHRATHTNTRTLCKTRYAN